MAKLLKEVYSVIFHSESGDDYGPYVWDGKPTPEQVWEVVLETDVWEDTDGGGIGGSFVEVWTQSPDHKTWDVGEGIPESAYLGEWHDAK